MLMQTPDKNIYTYDSFLIKSKNNAKVHYCHGAPGAIELFIKSYRFF